MIWNVYKGTRMLGLVNEGDHKKAVGAAAGSFSFKPPLRVVPAYDDCSHAASCVSALVTWLKGNARKAWVEGGRNSETPRARKAREATGLGLARG